MSTGQVKSPLCCLPWLLAMGIGSGASAGEAENPVVLVDQGKAHAVIAVSDQPSTEVSQAAAVFRDVVKEMTDVELEIRPQGELSGQATPILIGMSPLAKKCGIDVPQDLEDGDHYVVVANDRFVAAIGNDDRELRGTVYAVYDLLRRVGCDWFGEDSAWQIIPKRQTLAVQRLEVDQRPSFRMRKLWAPIAGPLRDAWRLGGQSIPANHNLEHLVPKDEYGQAHPDYFGPGQPCLTHPEVRKIIADRFGRELAKRAGKLSFSLSANDNDQFCRCDRCQEAGNVSAQMLDCANEISRELEKGYPGRSRVVFLAYWATHAPPRPMVRAQPGVCVMLVNEGDHTKPLSQPQTPRQVGNTAPRNAREVRDLSEWLRTGAEMAIYEWWIPAIGDKNWRRVPWYSGETSLRNLRYWKKHGVKYVIYEAHAEDQAFPLRWPLYYVAARGLWNTDLSAEQIMTEACNKLYGPAARPMRLFYQTIEEAMAVTTHASFNWHLPSPELIYTPSIERTADGHLDQAAALAAGHPKILKRIQDERQMWRRAKTTLAAIRRQRVAPKAE